MLKVIFMYLEYFTTVIIKLSYFRSCSQKICWAGQSQREPKWEIRGFTPVDIVLTVGWPDTDILPVQSLAAPLQSGIVHWLLGSVIAAPAMVTTVDGGTASMFLRSVVNLLYVRIDLILTNTPSCHCAHLNSGKAKGGKNKETYSI